MPTLSLDNLVKLYDDAKKYVDNGYRDKWDNCYYVYNGKRIFENYVSSTAHVQIREAHTIVETLVSNIAGGDTSFVFVPTNEEQAKDTDVLTDVVQYWIKCNKGEIKIQEWVRDMVMYGTGIMGVEWQEGKPFIFNIPIRDFFIDPTSTVLTGGVNSARYAGYESLMDKDELKSVKIFDAEKNKWVSKYSNLDKIGYDVNAKNGGNGDTGSMDKVFKDMFKGSALGDKATEHQVHVIKLYHLPTGMLYEIGNKKQIIYAAPMWTQRGESSKKIMVEVNGQPVESTIKLKEIKPFLPFVALRNYIESSQFYGNGDLELILEDNELLNDYEAIQIDNNAYQNTPMYWIDPAFADMIAEIETIAGAVYPIPRNAFGVLERPQLTNDVRQKQEDIMQRMRRATAADEAVQGGSVGNSRTTATEVSTQITQAQLRFSTKVKNLEVEGFGDLGCMLLKVAQIFLTKETAIRIVGKEGVSFKDYDPYEYDGDFECNVSLSTTQKKKLMESGQKDNQIYLILSQDPQGVFNPIEIKRWMIQKIDPDLSDAEFNKLLAPPKEPQEDVRDQSFINYKDAPPHTKAQLEMKAGLQPDPIHEIMAKKQLTEIASEMADLNNPMTDTQGRPLPGIQEALSARAQAMQPVETPQEMQPTDGSEQLMTQGA